MSTGDLSATVGRGGMNRREDVILVQDLLLARGYRIGTADGICGERTVTAIYTFQTGFLDRPDGRVDPGGRTWRMLGSPNQGPTQPTPSDTPALSRPVAKPLPSAMNPGPESVSNAYMTNKLGPPRQLCCSSASAPSLAGWMPGRRLRRHRPP